MSNTILIKRSSTANAVPDAGSLAQGELAINLTDGNLFYKNSSDQVTVIASNKFVNVSGAVSAGGNVTGANIVTAGQVSATGNISGNYFIGNGSQLTGVVASSAGSVDAGNLTGSTLSSNVTNSSLTSVGTLSSLSVTGTVTGGNISTAGFASAGGNVTGGNIVTAGQVSATGNISGSYILGNGALLSGIDAASIQNGNSNVRIADADGNISIGVGGTANVAVFSTGGVTVTGNVDGGNINGNGSGLSSITGANVTGTVGSATVAATVTTAAQPNITSVGTLTSVTVTGNIDGGNVSATRGAFTTVAGTLETAAQPNITSVGTLTSVSVTGNVDAGNVNGNGSGLTSITGANVTGQVGNALVAGTVYTAAQPNITSVGTLSSVSVTGTVTGGNLVTGGDASATGTVTGGNLATGGTVSATGNVTGGNIITSGDIIANSLKTSNALGNLTIAAGNILLSSGNSYIDVNNAHIHGVATPIDDTDATNKAYVDNLVTTAISYHDAVTAATNTTLATATGGTIAYVEVNGAGNGQGAKLTTTGSFELIDTANVQTVGTRVLVKNEANAVFNGVYTWANATSLVRATDCDTYGPADANKFSVNDYFFTTSGNVNAGSAFIVDSPTGTITFGTSEIQFAQFSSVQVYTANTSAGIILDGTIFSTKVDGVTTAFNGSGQISIPAGANLTTPNIGAATGTSVSVTGGITSSTVSATGNITGGNIITAGDVGAGSVTATTLSGGGGAISNITGANVTGQVGNALVAGTVYTAAQPNITSVGTLSSVTVTGNITGGNVTTAGTGNIATLEITTLANIKATTASTTTGTGALIVAGGVGVGGNIYAGDVYSTGNLVLTTSSTVDGGTY